MRWQCNVVFFFFKVSTNLDEGCNGAQRAAAAVPVSIGGAEHGGVSGHLPFLHHHLHQAVLVPGTVLHQVDEKTQALNTPWEQG